jgi:hypothetical protein
VQALSGDQGGHTWCKPGMQGRCVPHCGHVCPLPTTHKLEFLLTLSIFAGYHIAS